MSKTQSSEASAADRKWAERFMVNVVWGWLGVLAGFFTGFVLSPYIIRKLGDQRYGIWALAFAFIDYFSLFDFGFKSAIVKFVSEARALNDEERVNTIINTAFFYFLGIGAMLLVVTWSIADYLHLFFKISPQYRDEFASLVRIIGIGWAFAIAFNVYVAAQEAFQQFKFQNQVQIASLIFRSGSWALLLYFGYGLTTMGIAVVISQILNFTLAFLSVRWAFPGLRISPSLVSKKIWKELAGYGVHGFVGQIGGMMLNQGPAVAIGHSMPEAFVGYYTLPSRLLQYVVEFVTKIAGVAMPNTAEMLALGRKAQIAEMSVYLNRYSFALFLPLSSFLLVYGQPLIQMWVGKSFADQAAGLLVPFVLFTSFSIAGQYNSVGILYGMAKHSTYTKGILVEGLVATFGMLAVLPTYGLVGAAYVSAAAGIINRGLFTSYLLCNSLDLNWAGYMRSIYLRPLLLSAPTFALGYWMREHWIAGRNWFEILLALAILSVQYYIVFYFAGIDKEHRTMLVEWFLSLVRRILRRNEADMAH